MRGRGGEGEGKGDSLVPRPFEVEEKVHAWYTLFVHDPLSQESWGLGI